MSLDHDFGIFLTVAPRVLVCPTPKALRAIIPDVTSVYEYVKGKERAAARLFTLPLLLLLLLLLFLGISICKAPGPWPQKMGFHFGLLRRNVNMHSVNKHFFGLEENCRTVSVLKPKCIHIPLLSHIYSVRAGPRVVKSGKRVL